MAFNVLEHVDQGRASLFSFSEQHLILMAEDVFETSLQKLSSARPPQKCQDCISMLLYHLKHCMACRESLAARALI